VAVLWLFVKNPPGATPTALKSLWRGTAFQFLVSRRFCVLTATGVLLSAATVSDGFLYLLLQQRSGLSTGFFPLFYVSTACVYVVLSIPVGRLADRWGRLPVLSGYGAIAAIYVVLLSSLDVSVTEQVFCLLLLGLYYSATEGVLLAMASEVIPAESRTSGLAVLMTCISLAKMASSLLFGWLWQSWGASTAVLMFTFGLAAAILISVRWLREPREGAFAR
jgi:predicted MFS family arabinose efflux permease